MPPQLGRRFPPDWQGYPPHMSVRDLTLWRRFHTAYPTLATGYYFDVGLGNGDTQAQPPPGEVEAMWQRLTRFRADVLADTGPDWILIELRDNAGPGAFGALLTYAALWRADPPDDRPLTLWLVTNRIHPDLAPLLPTHDITLKIV